MNNCFGYFMILVFIFGMMTVIMDMIYTYHYFIE